MGKRVTEGSRILMVYYYEYTNKSLIRYKYVHPDYIFSFNSI